MTEREDMVVDDQAASFVGWKLKLVALLCGASVMGLEMAGVRLLEPYLGSTIYVWGAIIGIFLGALALGYYFGGRLADHSPKSGTLAVIILIAAVWIFAIPPVGIFLGETCSRNIADPRLAAFIAAFALYAVPSVLLGMVSPFAVRLSALELHKVGNVAGSLYAISTGGSIIGTFGVTFVLTEFFGTMYIIWGVGLTLLVASGLCLSRKKILSSQRSLMIIMTCACVAGFGGAKAATQSLHKPSVYPDGKYQVYNGGGYQFVSENGKNLDMAESPYHLINIYESDYNIDTAAAAPAAKRCRYMAFNNQTESGCMVNKDGTITTPYDTTCGYVRLLNLGVLVSGKQPRNIAVIGCGGGVGPKLFLQDYPDAIEHIDVADIDPVVFEIAGKYFGYPYPQDASGKISSHVMDGRRFLRTAGKKWDYIILDAYTSGGRIPRHLITKEFFQLASDKLSEEDGVVVCNIISAIDGEKGRLARAVARTMSMVYKNVYVFPRNPVRNQEGNTFIVATNHPEKLSNGAMYNRLNTMRWKVIKQPIDQAVNNAPATTIFTDADPVLTDDFCPTDSMVLAE